MTNNPVRVASSLLVGGLLMTGCGITRPVPGPRTSSNAPVTSSASRARGPARKAARHSATAPLAVHPFPSHIHGGLAGITPNGEVLFFAPATGRERTFQWNRIGIWDPVTGAHRILFANFPGHYTGEAVADKNWAVALYLPYRSSAQVPSTYLGQDGNWWRSIRDGASLDYRH